MGLHLRLDKLFFLFLLHPFQICMGLTFQCDDFLIKNEGIIDYFYLTKCSWMGNIPVLQWFTLGVMLFFLLYLLGTTADYFFCPSLQAIVEFLKLSPNIAGVTFLSFGNGSPDVFASIAAFSSRSPKIGLTGLLGAGLFVTTVVTASVGLAATNKEKIFLPLFARDLLFYFIGVCYVLGLYLYNFVQFELALGFFVVYGVYVVGVILTECYYNKPRQLSDSNRENNETTLLLHNKYLLLDQSNGIESFESPSNEKEFRAYRKSSLPTPIANSSLLWQYPKYNSDYILPTYDQLPDRMPSSTYSLNHSYMSRKRHESMPFLLTPISWTRQYHHGITDSFETTDSLDTTETLGSSPTIDFAKKKLRVLKSLLKFVCLPLTSLSMLLRRLTIPLVDESSWEKTYAVVNPPCALVMMTSTILGKMPWAFSWTEWTTVVGLSVVLSVWILATTSKHTPPVGIVFVGLLFLSFAMSVIWIMIIAKELLAVLEAIGICLGISEAVLGITVLAWGNSMGDLVANVAIAKDGFPMMALAGCFAGPMFNLLIGLGTSLTWTTLVNKSYSFDHSSSIISLSFLFLLISLVFHFIVVVLFQCGYPNWFCKCLLLLYVLYIILCLLLEVHGMS